MATEQPAQHVFAHVAHAEYHFPHGRLERVVIAETAVPEWSLNYVVEVVGLELRDPARALTPYAQAAQDLPLANTRAEQHRNRLEKRQIFLADVLVRIRPRHTERDVHHLQGLRGYAKVLPELGECQF